MKYLLYILSTIFLFTACSSDDPVIPKQDYTSFTIVQNEIDQEPNVVISYKNSNNHYIKIANIGTLKKGIKSSEIRVLDNKITAIYVFSDYFGTNRADTIFLLKKNIKNDFQITKNTKGIPVTNKNDPMQYPQ